MKIESLFLQLNENPNVIKEIEEEIDILVHSQDISETFKLYNSHIQEMKFYALKIIEQRIKFKKLNGSDLSMEIEFMKTIVVGDSSDKCAEVFATLGLYEWPIKFNDFFNIVIDLITVKREMGYKILLNFLYLVNYSQDINEARKNELKKAISIVSKGYMQLFEDDMAKYIIPILTESLKIIPKDFDYSIVFRKGEEYPELAVDFIDEMGSSSLNIAEVVELASKIPVSIRMIMFFTGLKNKTTGVDNIERMYYYVFRGLRHDLSTFIASVDFWTKLFSGNKKVFVSDEKKRHEPILCVISEVLSIYANLDDLSKSDVEGEVLGLMNVLIRNYTLHVFNFVRENGNLLPRKMAIFFIRKLNDHYVHLKNNNLNPEFSVGDLVFEDPVVMCMILVYTNNPNAINFIEFCDLSDREVQKMIVKLINSFDLNPEQINFILEKSKALPNGKANEVIVECYLKLGKVENIEEPWDDDKFFRFFFYLKKAPSQVMHLSESYFRAFIEKSPFDRCFAILRMLGNFPKEIYEKIYSDLNESII